MSKTIRYVAISILVMFGHVQFAARADSARMNPHERSAATHPEEMRTMLYPGLQRDLIPLSEPEIRKGLIGQRFAADRELDWKPNKTSIWFTEAFLPDGSWVINKTVRFAFSEKGVWRIRDGKICTRVIQSPVGVKGAREVCRQVWRDRSSGKIAMIDAQSTFRDVLIFSSSPLK